MCFLSVKTVYVVYLRLSFCLTSGSDGKGFKAFAGAKVQLFCEICKKKTKKRVPSCTCQKNVVNLQRKLYVYL